jgi:hypothetical protein
MRRVLFAGLCATALSGCLDELVATVPSGPDFAAAPVVSGGDLGGGTASQFDPTIQADIDRLGCSSASCHGSGLKPALKAAPQTAADKLANYTAFVSDAMAGASSLVLTKPLAASGVSHGGGKLFSSTSDATYARWLAWVDAGGPQ